jgi:hypothetical protein
MNRALGFALGDVIDASQSHSATHVHDPAFPQSQTVESR